MAPSVLPCRLLSIDGIDPARRVFRFVSERFTFYWRCFQEPGIEPAWFSPHLIVVEVFDHRRTPRRSAGRCACGAVGAELVIHGLCDLGLAGGELGLLPACAPARAASRPSSNSAAVAASA